MRQSAPIIRVLRLLAATRRLRVLHIQFPYAGIGRHILPEPPGPLQSELADCCATRLRPTRYARTAVAAPLVVIIARRGITPSADVVEQRADGDVVAGPGHDTIPEGEVIRAVHDE